MESSSI
ncbi:hypothetical protein L195_g063158, partial [Trifolium pratense]